MGFEDFCNTSLSLGLGNQNKPKNPFQSHHQHENKIQRKFDDHSFPSLSLGLSSEETYFQDTPKMDFGKAKVESIVMCSSIISGVSSYSNSSVKKEREGSGEEMKMEKMITTSKINDEDEEYSARKKLRLTKEQSVVLEDSFKEHSTLNPKEKQALAKYLSLRPRQVEVWFQNRRARTKLKQTEVDYGFLKKWCETLTDENRRLHKELRDLKALKLSAPFCMQLPAATLTMCPSCERTSTVGDDNTSRNPFPIGSKSQFYCPFTFPSAAC